MTNINNMNRKITTGDSLHVYGSLGLGIDYTVRLALRLRDEVDGDMLCEALKKTEKRYYGIAPALQSHRHALSATRKNDKGWVCRKWPPDAAST